MKQLLLISVIALLACSRTQTSNQEFNIVVDEILRYELSDVDLLILETKPVKKTNSLDIMPSIGYNYLNYFESKGFIRKKDVEFIYKNMDSTVSILLDSSIIETKTIHKSELSQMFTSMGLDSAVNYLNEKSKVFYSATFSTPLFSKDKTRVIFWVDKWHSPTWACGYIYIAEKKNKKWRLIYKSATYKC